MSIHPSFKPQKGGSKKRNVLTRYERIRKMTEKGTFIEGSSPYNLPKTKTS